MWTRSVQLLLVEMSSTVLTWSELHCRDYSQILGLKLQNLAQCCFLSPHSNFLPALQSTFQVSKNAWENCPCYPALHPPFLPQKGVNQSKKKNMLGKCPKNITLMAVYMHYGIARYHFHHPPPTHRFSSSLCPRASASFAPPKGLTSVFQVYRPSPFSPILKKSNHAPRSNDLNYLSRQNLLRVYRPSPQKHTHIKFSIEIQGVPRI